jgi:hypothetical protein
MHPGNIPVEMASRFHVLHGIDGHDERHEFLFVKVSPDAFIQFLRNPLFALTAVTVLCSRPFSLVWARLWSQILCKVVSFR